MAALEKSHLCIVNPPTVRRSDPSWTVDFLFALFVAGLEAGHEFAKANRLSVPYGMEKHAPSKLRFLYVNITGIPAGLQGISTTSAWRMFLPLFSRCIYLYNMTANECSRHSIAAGNDHH